MTAHRKPVDETRAPDIEEAPAPLLSAADKRALVESLDRAEQEIDRGAFRVLVPELFVKELKTKICLNR